MIKFTCPSPSCRAALQAAEELAGKSMVCSSCKNSATVPQTSEANAIKPAANAGLPVFPSMSAMTTPEAVQKSKAGKPQHDDRNDEHHRENLSIAAKRVPWLSYAILGVVGVGAVVAILGFSFSGPAGPAGPRPIVVIETSMGTIKAELFQDQAPISTENFLAYVDKKHYDGTIFHRVIEDFMIQGGGFEPGMKKEKKSGNPIRNEAGNGLSNERGTLAMARTGDPHSATAQFYINVKNNTNLDKAKARDGWGYTVFGKVVAGMDVVDAIRRVEIDNIGMHEAVPVKDVIIKSIRRVVD